MRRRLHPGDAATDILSTARAGAGRHVWNHMPAVRERRYALWACIQHRSQPSGFAFTPDRRCTVLRKKPAQARPRTIRINGGEPFRSTVPALPGYGRQTVDQADVEDGGDPKEPTAWGSPASCSSASVRQSREWRTIRIGAPLSPTPQIRESVGQYNIQVAVST